MTNSGVVSCARIRDINAFLCIILRVSGIMYCYTQRYSYSRLIPSNILEHRTATLDLTNICQIYFVYSSNICNIYIKALYLYHLIVT